jgi:HD-like signal output (HDOD) protein
VIQLYEMYEVPMRTDLASDKENTVHNLLKSRVEGIKAYLPAMSDAMAEIVGLLSQDDADIRTCAVLIEKDPAMVVNILRVANSAFYGLPNRVLTVGHALTMLGREEVMSLCIAWIASKALQAPPGQTTVNLSRLWRHSVATGMFARILAKELNLKAAASFYLGGLMHDVGKIILDRFFHAQYETILKLTSQHNISLRDAELQVMGESHDTVGRWLLDAWGLPEVYREVSGCHHSVLSASSENRAMVSLVALADEMARLTGFGFGSYEGTAALHETEAFSVMAAEAPGVIQADLGGFIADLDEIARDIEEIQAVMYRKSA